MISKIEETKAYFDAIEEGMYGKKNVADALALIYHENSKFNVFSQRRQGEKIGIFYNPYITERSSQPFKHYPGAEKVELVKYDDYPSPKVDLFETILNRRSLRDFNPDYQVSERELQVLLKHSYAVTQRVKMNDVDGHMGFRPVPSPGGLYALELYIVLFKSQIGSGIFHFRPDDMSLEKIVDGNMLETFKEIVTAEPYININNASGMVITTGLYERLAIKYGERAYRFMIHESGFVAQNMSLVLEAIGLGSCMVGGYLDDKVNEMLNIDGVFETTHNILIFGKK